jgi:hypothetical protein
VQAEPVREEWAVLQELIGSVNTSALPAIYPSECYATTNFFERDSWTVERDCT